MKLKRFMDAALSYPLVFFLCSNNKLSTVITKVATTAMIMVLIPMYNPACSATAPTTLGITMLPKLAAGKITLQDMGYSFINPPTIDTRVGYKPAMLKPKPAMPSVITGRVFPISTSTKKPTIPALCLPDMLRQWQVFCGC